MKEKKNLNISSIISVSTRMENRWSGICCLTKNVGKMFWKFQNGKRWMRMMKLTMKKKNSEFFLLVFVFLIVLIIKITNDRSFQDIRYRLQKKYSVKMILIYNRLEND